MNDSKSIGDQKAEESSSGRLATRIQRDGILTPNTDESSPAVEFTSRADQITFRCDNPSPNTYSPASLHPQPQGRSVAHQLRLPSTSTTVASALSRNTVSPPDDTSTEGIIVQHTSTAAEPLDRPSDTLSLLNFGIESQSSSGPAFFPPSANIRDTNPSDPPDTELYCLHPDAKSSQKSRVKRVPTPDRFSPEPASIPFDIVESKEYVPPMSLDPAFNSNLSRDDSTGYHIIVPLSFHTNLQSWNKRIDIAVCTLAGNLPTEPEIRSVRLGLRENMKDEIILHAQQSRINALRVRRKREQAAGRTMTDLQSYTLDRCERDKWRNTEIQRIRQLQSAAKPVDQYQLITCHPHEAFRLTSQLTESGMFHSETHVGFHQPKRGDELYIVESVWSQIYSPFDGTISKIEDDPRIWRVEGTDLIKQSYDTRYRIPLRDQLRVHEILSSSEILRPNIPKTDSTEDATENEQQGLPAEYDPKNWVITEEELAGGGGYDCKTQ